MTPSKDDLYVRHILDCIESVERYYHGGARSLEDEKTYDAILRKLQIMAESCQRLSDETKAAASDID